VKSIGRLLKDKVISTIAGWAVFRGLVQGETLLKEAHLPLLRAH